MCGIFGYVVSDDSDFSQELFRKSLARLFELSESRGKEASGLALRAHDQIRVYKEAVAARKLIRNKAYHELLAEMLASPTSSKVVPAAALIGHSRLATNGYQGINSNNQPVISDGVVGVHNGIIVNVDALWKKFSHLQRKYDVDTEIFLKLVRVFYEDEGSLPAALEKTYREIEGSASVGILFNDLNNMLLATNTGSLYVSRNGQGKAFFFASEEYILKKFLDTDEVKERLGPVKVQQLKAGTGCLVDLDTLSLENFSYNSFQPSPSLSGKKHRTAFKVRDCVEEDEAARRAIRRCTRCILPETMPFIEFDEAGVCNYCRNYSKIEYRGKDALEAAVAPFRTSNGQADCIIAFSGGRDSSYSLHYAKRVLGLNPIAYTYDWGMVNDLARRNQARLTGKLGVEQIIVSADIKKKRKNIKRNVEAWLKKPDLGTVPLFMAGDKQFFYYANELRQKTGIKLFIWAENQLERTNFKVGFCDIAAGNTKDRIYKMSLSDKSRLATYYLKQFILNPSYLNRSIGDTLFAYFSYYMIDHDYLWFYDYIPWIEDEISETLIKEYDWETARDTTSTWRIGDATASFYNYIYYSVAGFSENDSFRSNQIREGLLPREQALRMVEEENAPRYDSIMEYLQLIGVDFDETLSVINSIPKLYPTRDASR